MSYNFIKWATKYGLPIPEEIVTAAKMFDPVFQKVSRFPRQYSVLRNRAGELIKTSLSITSH